MAKGAVFCFNLSMEYDREKFGTNNACLQFIFDRRFPTLKKYYRVKGRNCFANYKGKQIHPLKGTIFENSSTPLVKWFYAIYLFSTSKNGVSSKELQRQLDVTYKCAWRIGSKIRELMKQEDIELNGIKIFRPMILNIVKKTRPERDIKKIKRLESKLKNAEDELDVLFN